MISFVLEASNVCPIRENQWNNAFYKNLKVEMLTNSYVSIVLNFVCTLLMLLPLLNIFLISNKPLTSLKILKERLENCLLIII